MRYVPDKTGRFSQRPHFEPEELDTECERIITEFLGSPRLQPPIGTDDLTKLIERKAADLDLYADLSSEGPDVEGVTDFLPGEKPSVRVAHQLSEEPRRQNRLRTTLTHEYGHVKFHGFLWDVPRPTASLFPELTGGASPKCRRANIIGAPSQDWMEWQAGYICGALLIPISHVRRLVQEHFEAKSLYGPLSVQSAEAAALIERVAELFMVSREAARVRLSQLRYLTHAESAPSLLGG